MLYTPHPGISLIAFGPVSSEIVWARDKQGKVGVGESEALGLYQACCTRRVCTGVDTNESTLYLSLRRMLRICTNGVGQDLLFFFSFSFFSFVGFVL